MRKPTEDEIRRTEEQSRILRECLDSKGRQANANELSTPGAGSYPDVSQQPEDTEIVTDKTHPREKKMTLTKRNNRYTVGDWQKLTAEAHAIRTALKRRGYKLRKQHKALAFTVDGDGSCHLLTYLPRPVVEWVVLPKEDSPLRSEIIAIVKEALK